VQQQARRELEIWNTSRRIGFKDLHGVVSGPIVNGIDREILMGLRQHTVESATDILFDVVAGNNDIDFGLGW
jgi:hypothetical protein